MEGNRSANGVIGAVTLSAITPSSLAAHNAKANKSMHQRSGFVYVCIS